MSPIDPRSCSLRVLHVALRAIIIIKFFFLFIKCVRYSVCSVYKVFGKRKAGSVYVIFIIIDGVCLQFCLLSVLFFLVPFSFLQCACLIIPRSLLCVYVLRCVAVFFLLSRRYARACLNTKVVSWRVSRLAALRAGSPVNGLYTDGRNLALTKRVDDAKVYGRVLTCF